MPTIAIEAPRVAAPRRPEPPVRVPPASVPLHPTELDARGITPPHPLIAVVVALEAIPPRTPQYVRTRGAPIELLRELSQRGVEAYPRELPDGSWRTLLLCGAPARLRTPPLSRRTGAITQA